MERVKALDGLRGVAVILVIALHSFNRAADFTKHPILESIARLTSIGWVGVDIFFVLSGFLITSILLRTKDDAHYFKNFYVRRALRIFPLYYVGITAILLLMPLLDPGYVMWIRQDLPYLLLYQNNWLYLFGTHSLTAYVGVTWSLAIEEQFYVLWPAVVYFASRTNLLRIGLGAMLLSFLGRAAVLTLAGDYYFLAARFFFLGTFTRFEELIAGGMLALLLTLPGWPQRIRRVAAPVFWSSLAVFLWLCLRTYPATPHPAYGSLPLAIGSYTSAAFFTSALIALLVTPPQNSIAARLLGNPFLTLWGKYSYSAYLFHVPIALKLLDLLSAAHWRGWRAYTAYLLLTFGLSLLLAIGTWNLLEKHFLALKKHFESPAGGGQRAEGGRQEAATPEVGDKLASSKRE